MRFIGCKRKLLPFLDSHILKMGAEGAVFCDLFAGTAAVGQHYKRAGFRVFSTDTLYFSYVLQRTYVEINVVPSFSGLSSIVGDADGGLLENSGAAAAVNFLNQLKGEEGFIYRHYTPEGTKGERYVRKYFTAENGKKIDAVREQIEIWRRRKQIDETEYYYLLCALIEAVPSVSNTSGTYAAFLKSWDSRAHKSLRLNLPEIIPSMLSHRAANEDCASFVRHMKKADVLYLDPPYNSRQYASNYHILETIARRDAPGIRGVSGMRDYHEQKSAFCYRAGARQALNQILSDAKYRYLVMSYNNEGILPREEILSLMRRHGKTCSVEKEYPRYKSNGNGNGKRRVKESVYLLKPVNPKNALNDLSGAEWLYFLQSVDSTAYSVRGEDGFAHDLRRAHPSPKPPQLMQKYAEFFTKENQIILDPFMGVGGVLLGAALCGRRAVGVELSQKYIDTYRAVCTRLNLKRQKTIAGDSMNLSTLLPRRFACDMILTDPPYGGMLSQKRGGQKRKDTGETRATPFTNVPEDLGNMDECAFFSALRNIMEQASSFLRPKGYAVVFAKDMQPKGKAHNMLHCAVVEEILKIPALSFRGYKIWHDRTPKLYPFGYPHAFVANQIHQFALIFRKEK